MIVPCIVIVDMWATDKTHLWQFPVYMQLQCTRSTKPFTLIDLRDPTDKNYCSKDFFFLSGSKWFTETHGKPKVLWSVNSWHLSTRERQNNRWNRCDNNERLYAGMWLASFTVFLISTGGTWHCSSKALSTFRPWNDYDLSHQNYPSWWLAVPFPSSNITRYLFL